MSAQHDTFGCSECAYGGECEAERAARRSALLAAYLNTAAWNVTAAELIADVRESGFDLQHEVLPAMRASGWDQRSVREVEHAACMEVHRE